MSSVEAMDLDLSNMTMTEIIRLQNQLSQELSRRFERPLAVAFTDVVGSTAYFARFGDEAGRKLQQRHFDLLAQCLPKAQGRVVDTAGDGALLVFPSVDAATDALIDLQKTVSTDNVPRQREHQMNLRTGIHWGSVLTDDVQVTGDAVNLCARVTGTAQGGEIRLTREAFLELTDVTRRLACQPLPVVELKGIFRTVEMLALRWRDRSLFPDQVRIVESGQVIALPEQDTISFGRLKDAEGGMPANDVVLALPDEARTRQISRWHFELRRRSDGFVLRPVSDHTTEVNGVVASKGAEVQIRPGAVVRVARVMTLVFTSTQPDRGKSDATVLSST
jgi:class 3 adenylate cyclase